MRMIPGVVVVPAARIGVRGGMAVSRRCRHDSNCSRGAFKAVATCYLGS